MVFLVATFVHSGWLLAAQRAAGLDVEFFSSMQLGPGLGLLTTAVLLRRRVAALLPRPAESPGHLGARLAVAALVMAGFTLLTLALAALAGVRPDHLPYGGATLAAFLVIQFVGACGEEVGWRGFLQPAFRTRLGVVGAAVVVGVIWSAWHVDRLGDPAVFAGFTLTAIALSLALALLGGGTWWQRGLVAGFAHWAVNVALVLAVDPEPATGGGSADAIAVFALPPILLGVLVWAGWALGRRRGQPSPSATR